MNRIMFASPQIGWKPLAQFCRRLGTALAAGVDVRRVLEREAATGTPWQKRQLSQVRDAVDQGESLTGALGQTGPYFPRFFLEMVDVGEQTGKLDHILPKLAEYYEHLVQLRRVFLVGIAWPALQLVVAVCVIALLILALGWVANMTGEETDVLGFGLVGVPGLIRYFVGIGLFVAAGMILYRLCTRGPLAHVVGQTLMRIPGLGPNLRMMSLGASPGRWAWHWIPEPTRGNRSDWHSPPPATHTTRSTLRTAIRRSGVAAISMKLLQRTGAFPDEFLDAVEVGEQSGRISETLLKLAEDYRELRQGHHDRRDPLRHHRRLGLRRLPANLFDIPLGEFLLGYPERGHTGFLVVKCQMCGKAAQ